MAQKLILTGEMYDDVVRIALELTPEGQRVSRSAVAERLPNISLASLGKVLNAAGLIPGSKHLEGDRQVVSKMLERGGETGAKLHPWTTAKGQKLERNFAAAIASAHVVAKSVASAQKLSRKATRSRKRSK